MSSPIYPFSAIVGQDDMKLALLIAAIDQKVGGVLVFGDRGTGKSTTVRALAALLPPMPIVTGCRFNCAPDKDCTHVGSAPVDAAHVGSAPVEAVHVERPPSALRQTSSIPVPVVDLPLGATEDRVLGALDLERALVHGEKAFEPGLLARAHRGFLYIDEVNLLEDHLVDLLLDVAASGENVVEREGLSVRHASRFVLVGTGNPEEGELRPQLLDRFGLFVEVRTPEDIKTRIEIVRRRDTFERNPAAFLAQWEKEEDNLRTHIVAAQQRLENIHTSSQALERVTQLCMEVGTDGLRGELTLLRAARALAALENTDEVEDVHLRRVAPLALRHRLKRTPLSSADSGSRVERAVSDLFGGSGERLMI